MLSLKMDSLLNPQSSHGIMDDEKLVQLQDYGVNVSDCSSTLSSINGEDEEDEEVNSSGSSSGPLHDKTSLLQQLPSKRGLSKHYNGKSQSFTSLSAVACIEDLAKPDNPYNKRLETSKSLPTNKSCSSLIAKRSSNKNKNKNKNNNDKKGSGFISVGGGRKINSGFLGRTGRHLFRNHAERQVRVALLGKPLCLLDEFHLLAMIIHRQLEGNL